VNVTSGAREKVDHAKATATAVLSKTAHPFNSQARQEADAKAVETKAQASAKQASIRTTVQQQQQQQQKEATTPRTSIPSGTILMRSKSSCKYMMDGTST
jgi:hypothetical protein